MTPEERNLITELFNRLVTLENSPRDPAAEQAIYQGFQQAPNAAYALVQTVLVQDETLKRAEARIRELEEGPSAEPPRDTSFLGSMRQAIGMGEPRRAGSVPSVKPGMSSAWHNTGTPAQPEPMQAPPMQAQMQPQAAPGMAPGYGSGGSSFLGTAAAAAAGVVGGSLLMGGLRSMMGGGPAHSAFDPSAGAARGGSPWTGGSDGGNLSRQVGLDDMGKTPGARGDDASRSGFFGSDNDSRGSFAAGQGDDADPNDDDNADDDNMDFDDGDDLGGDGGSDE
jgi:uncharacterized protein